MRLRISVDENRNPFLTQSPSPNGFELATTSSQPLKHRPHAGRRGPDPLHYRHRHRSLRDYAQLLALRYDQARTRHSYYRQFRLLADHFERL
jgi:hypothetical protein